MKIQEALKLTLRENKKGNWVWCRPVDWRCVGIAICIQDEKLRMVPDPRGGIRWIPSFTDLVNNWEVVEPDIVLGERDKIRATETEEKGLTD